jgi:hypothetical protein
MRSLRIFTKKAMLAWVLIMWAMFNFGSTADWVVNRLPHLVQFVLSRIPKTSNGVSWVLLIVGFCWLAVYAFWSDLLRLLKVGPTIEELAMTTRDKILRVLGARTPAGVSVSDQAVKEILGKGNERRLLEVMTLLEQQGYAQRQPFTQGDLTWWTMTTPGPKNSGRMRY